MTAVSFPRGIRYFFTFCALFGLHLSGSAASATFEVVNDWGSGFTGSITVTNDGTEPMEEWELTFDFARTINSVWNAERVFSSGNQHTFRNASWNGRLAPGQSATFGFTASPGNVGADQPTAITFAGDSPTDDSNDNPGDDPVNGSDPNGDSTDQSGDRDSGENGTDDPEEDDSTQEPGDSSGSASVQFDVTSTWSSGYTAYVRLTNNGMTAIDGWTVQFDLADPIVDFWGATGGSNSGNTYTFSNESWNGSILPGQTVSFGIQAGAADSQSISNIVLNDGNLGGEEVDEEVADGGDDPTGGEDDNGVSDPVNDDITNDVETGEEELGPITNGKRVVAYFPSWGIYSKDYQVEDIPAESLTHIIHAFATISAEGEIGMIDPWADIEIPLGPDTWDTPIRGNFGAYARLKEAHPDLRILIAVGGWFDSGRFSDVASTAAARQKFAASVREFVVQYGFDGVDLDWEYPVVATGVNGNVRPEDGTNYAKLAATIRAELDAQSALDGKTYEISAATPAGYDKFEKIDLAALADELDFINLMGYDFHGRWVKNQTGHNAPLFGHPSDPNPRYNVDSAVSGYLDAGVPSEKLVLGIPSYGYGWSGANSVTPFESATGIGPGTLPAEPGFYDYRTVADLGRQFPENLFWDEDAQASIYYDGDLWISYESPRSLKRKLNYIEEKNLGGAMFWETSTDIRDNTHPDQLMKIAGDALK